MEQKVILRVVDLSNAENTTHYFESDLGETHIAFVDQAALLEAQECVRACEHCADNATVTFDYFLDALTGCDPTMTEYLMCRPAKCPHCRSEITEKTLVVAR